MLLVRGSGVKKKLDLIRSFCREYDVDCGFEEGEDYVYVSISNADKRIAVTISISPHGEIPLDKLNEEFLAKVFDG